MIKALETAYVMPYSINMSKMHFKLPFMLVQNSSKGELFQHISVNCIVYHI